jgi:trimeric autotransporter adhesin
MFNIFKTQQSTSLKATVAFIFASVFAILPTHQAQAYQIPADAGNAWVVAGATATKSTPSGVRVNIAITGAPTVFQTLNNTTFMAGAGATGATVGTFTTPALPQTTNGLQIFVGTTGCQTAFAASTSCSGLGTMTASFTDAAGLPIAVRNPVMHLSRVAGNYSDGTGAIILGYGTTFTLTSGGATLNAPSAGSDALTVAGTTISPVVSLNSTANCTNGTGGAGCGSIPITGTVSSLAFNLGAVRNATNVAWNNIAGSGDAWFVTFSFDEDFGDVPASYQGAVGAVGTAPASHIQSDLTLGSAWTAANNNTAVLNGSSAGAAPFQVSPVQVAAGAVNTGAAGDGVEENGLALPVASIITSQIGSTYTLTPTLSGASRAGNVCGWIDFNRDGVFTAGEGSCFAFATGATSASLNWTVPAATTAGRAYMRIRASYAAMTTTSINGLLNSGEVEDYSIEIKPAVQVVKVLSPTADSGTFNLSIGGVNLATAVGNGGTTGFRSVYQATSTVNDVTVGVDVAAAAVSGVILTEAGAGATVLADYNTTSTCTNAAGTAVAVGGTALAPSITIPQSITGASANGLAQTITCTLTNTRKSASISITKTDNKAVTTSGLTNNYVITITNQGPFSADGAVLTDTVGVGLTCPPSNVVTCSGATNGAICPVGPLTIANLTGVGITVATLPVNGALQFAYLCNVN